MCKAAAEAGMKEEGQEKVGAGLNKGILYLMSIPYLMGAVVGIAMVQEQEEDRRNFNIRHMSKRLYNRIGKDLLKERLMNEPFQRRTVSFIPLL